MSITNIPTRTYRYTPLSTKDHTRILELEPAEAEDAPLCCRLREVNVETENYMYEALSYTWGEPIFSHELMVEDEMMKITSSLAGALRRFRSKDRTRSIWADAVCINQQDNEEKSVQIPMMSKIYRSAHRVLVWLGNPVREDAVLDRLSVLAKRLFIDRQTSSRTLTDACLALLKLLYLPWFTRRWIVQEVAQNPDVMLYHGVSELPWPRLFTIVRSLTAKSAELKTSRQVISVMAMHDLWKLWGFGDRNGPCGMIWLLEKFDHFKCADDRDRIYALVGLADDVGNTPSDEWQQSNKMLSIKADYTLTTFEVYTQFAMTVINEKHKILWLLRQASSRYRSEGFPGWLPNWSMPLARRPVVDNLDMSVSSTVSILLGGRAIYMPSILLHYSKVKIADPLRISHYRKHTTPEWESGPEGVKLVETFADVDVSPVCVKWRSKAFPPSPCSPSEVTHWFQDTFDSICQRVLEVGAAATLDSKNHPTWLIRTLNDFIRALLPSEILDEFYQNGEELEYNRLVEKLGYRANKPIMSKWGPEYNPLDESSEQGFERGTKIGIASSDSLAQALISLLERSSSGSKSVTTCLPVLFVNLLSVVMRGRRVIICDEDRVSGAYHPDGHIGIATSTIREQDRVISPCHPGRAGLDLPGPIRCACPCRKYFMVRERKDSILSDLEQRVSSQTLYYEFVGDGFFEKGPFGTYKKGGVSCSVSLT
ncbi:HET-domain-containing protein [Lophiostoma macrostomum CBS 122681]|uniref:HET-domain-containing protein n=1 Tax=Lophiostoma macrostomum CBS 122681 TaxID=1314788 RepID=A0A6A6TSN2_9PLEO|nr:HET-domain-containing protein [Lophiostoma macrostomum CBS 122681]